MLTQLSYLKAFKNFADSVLDEATEFVQIVNYANLLTQKANQLISHAALNENIDLPGLQKDIFEAGVIYIKKFSEKFKEGSRHKPEYNNMPLADLRAIPLPVPVPAR